MMFDIARDASFIAFISSEPASSYEVWIQDSQGTRQLTNVNAEILKDYVLSEPEEFWFKASDGIEIQGWIIKPVDFNEKKKYPTIINVHGGPMGFHGYGFNHGLQVLTRHGYIVVYTNPRMSIGYGEKFAAECCGHYGEKDYSDVMEAVDYVASTYPFIDTNRLGIEGHSYGGFMMNWIVSHTDRFKACISTASISNWDSFFGVSDIGTYWVPWQIGFGKEPWDSGDLHAEKSPFSHAGSVNTPVLFMHGDKDYRCPLDQSEQFYVALKKKGVETELIIFPDESHLILISGKPTHRREWMRHKLRWFEKYLK
jgi:dipeptidyl aminopeptidase/acylaminoacyl peptidase